MCACVCVRERERDGEKKLNSLKIMLQHLQSIDNSRIEMRFLNVVTKTLRLKFFGTLNEDN